MHRVRHQCLEHKQEEEDGYQYGKGATEQLNGRNDQDDSDDEKYRVLRLAFNPNPRQPGPQCPIDRSHSAQNKVEQAHDERQHNVQGFFQTCCSKAPARSTRPADRRPRSASLQGPTLPLIADQRSRLLG